MGCLQFRRVWYNCPVKVRKDQGGVATVPTLSDYIERYLRDLLEETGEMVEIRRGELAERFRCVPSQINYVLETRFTPERGYVIESRRGGGGYIRIFRLADGPETRLIRRLFSSIGDKLGVAETRGYLQRLLEAEIISPREAQLMAVALGVDPGARTRATDGWRAVMMRRLLSVISSTSHS